MRVLLALLVITGVAAADTARRKTSPDRYTRAASEAFAAALEADQKGDTKAATGLYEKALSISPHPSTAYNIADIERRRGDVRRATRFFEMYLALAPQAPDRREVEAWIAQLSKTPGIAFLTTAAASDPRAIELTRAYVLFDGEIVRRPGTALASHPKSPTIQGLSIEMPSGDHHVDVVTSITHGQTTCRVIPNEVTFCTAIAPPRVDGSVILSGEDDAMRVYRNMTDRYADSLLNKRIVLPAGRTRMYVRDHYDFECPALDVDVPAGGDVAYVFLAPQENNSVERCRKFKVKRHLLELD